jgi:hypothetical protein
MMCCHESLFDGRPFLHCTNILLSDGRWARLEGEIECNFMSNYIPATNCGPFKLSRLSDTHYKSVV